MYLYGKNRGMGQDVSASALLANVSGTSAGIVATQPVSVSPWMLGGLGLMALFFVVSTTRKTAMAVGRKGRAMGRALRA